MEFSVELEFLRDDLVRLSGLLAEENFRADFLGDQVYVPWNFHGRPEVILRLIILVVPQPSSRKHFFLCNRTAKDQL